MVHLEVNQNVPVPKNKSGVNIACQTCEQEILIMIKQIQMFSYHVNKTNR